jgi:phosphoribosylaminoimidazole-succinocarboxamide synthase
MQKLVIIQGSEKDSPYAEEIISAVRPYGISVERRIASAHRTNYHLQRILDMYEDQFRNGVKIVYITVAGLSDGLTGVVASRQFPTIACPPDAAEFGEMKRFSSTKLPKGIEAEYASAPSEVPELVNKAFENYDFERISKRKLDAFSKACQTVRADAKLQGVDHPLSLTLWKKGKVRDVYDLGSQLLINSSDRISAFNRNSVTEIEGKGMWLNLLSTWWFKQTNHIFPNHFIKTPDVTMMLVEKAERIDIEWIVRGYLYGSLHRDYKKGNRELYGYKLPDGLQLAEKLPEVMLTPTTKADTGDDVPVTKQQAIDLGLTTPEEWETLEEASFKLYEYYTDVAGRKGFIIPDFKIEFGRCGGNLKQIDEPPTHDSARIWVKKYYQVGKRQEAWCVDKEFYRQFLIDSGIDPENPPNQLPEIPEPVVREIQKRLRAYEVFTGKRDIDGLGLRSLEDVEKELGVVK